MLTHDQLIDIVFSRRTLIYGIGQEVGKSSPRFFYEIAFPSSVCLYEGV
jgi:hypothetical protein